MRTSRRVFVGSFLVGCGAILAAASRAQPAMPNMPSSTKMPNMAMPGAHGSRKGRRSSQLSS